MIGIVAPQAGVKSKSPGLIARGFVIPRCEPPRASLEPAYFAPLSTASRTSCTSEGML
jgi:hypothetical protein